MIYRTFGTTVPGYFLGRPREVYETRYGTGNRVVALAPIEQPKFELPKAA